MGLRLRLYGADLYYAGGMTVHTALSGPVSSLAELYLVIEDGAGWRGVGEVRANITFLTGIAADAVPETIRRAAAAIDWSGGLDWVYAHLHAHIREAPSLAQAALDLALVDGMARQAGVPAAQYLGGTFQRHVRSNQCLFLGMDEDAYLALGARYAGEGFRPIKVRLGAEGFEGDLARLRRLRERLGPDVPLAADVNGMWSVDETRARLARMAALGLSYLEQPTAPSDWRAFAQAGAGSPIPLMADEGLKGPADIEALARLGPPFMAHLKIVKAGGARPLIADAKRLQEAGIAIQVGQMNEGGLATSATAHAALVVKPAEYELYGAYGLIDDPAPGLSYGGGGVVLPEGPGWGLDFDAARATLLWEMTP